MVPGSGPGWDRFMVVPSEDHKSGSLVPISNLDYEDPDQRHGFKFKVQVTDKVRNILSTL